MYRRRLIGREWILSLEIDGIEYELQRSPDIDARPIQVEVDIFADPPAARHWHGMAGIARSLAGPDSSRSALRTGHTKTSWRSTKRGACLCHVPRPEVRPGETARTFNCVWIQQSCRARGHWRRTHARIDWPKALTHFNPVDVCVPTGWHASRWATRQAIPTEPALGRPPGPRAPRGRGDPRQPPHDPGRDRGGRILPFRACPARPGSPPRRQGRSEAGRGPVVLPDSGPIQP